MYINDLHRSTKNGIEVQLNKPDVVQLLGEFCITLGDVTVHLTRDDAERLSLELTSAFVALLGDLDTVRHMETA